MAKLHLTDRELKSFNEEYQDDVFRDLKKGDESFSYNEVQFRLIPKMAEKVISKKKEKEGGEFKLISMNYGSGEDEKSSIVGWKIVKIEKKEKSAEEIRIKTLLPIIEA